MCVKKNRRETKLFKGFTQRSVGPLWGLLRHCLEQLGNEARMSASYQELVTTYYEEVNKAITYFGQEKHEKASVGEFNPRVVRIIANISRKVFAQDHFGLFEGVQQERFKAGSFKGRFRLAVGSTTSFIGTEEYSGSVSFPNSEAYVVDFTERSALALHPFVVWYQCEKHAEEEHCYFYDSQEGEKPYKSFSFKAIGFPCSLTVSSEHDMLAPIAEELATYLESDPQLQTVKF